MSQHTMAAHAYAFPPFLPSDLSRSSSRTSRHAGCNRARAQAGTSQSTNAIQQLISKSKDVPQQVRHILDALLQDLQFSCTNLLMV